MSVSKKTIFRGALLLAPTILALLLVGGYWLSREEIAREQAREAPVPSTVGIEVVKGVTTLTVDRVSQERSGIVTQPIGAATQANGPVVYGVVIDAQPLVELAARHAAMTAELSAARQLLASNGAEAKRVQALYHDQQNVSLRALGTAQAAEAEAAARANTARANLDSVAAALRQQFGPVLATWADSPSSPRLAPFAARREVLVRFVFASVDQAPPALAVQTDNHEPLTATRVSSAPQTDPGVQGHPFIYRSAAPIAAGTRVMAHLSGAQAGLRIPAESIVWYGGQPWAFVRTSDTRFERRAVEQGMPSNGDFMVTRGFKAGEQVVTQGAQLLLSEESRALLNK
ncbi:metal transporter [Massilia horti]|uniref:Metal transporter n=1 Tax=Massilia horti TaxID=2562153 RepID=A0A4Y9SV66_9BURK|nr:metal transporter [Massilia horti]TFW29104.1 metal transporter [Massilia horti]